MNTDEKPLMEPQMKRSTWESQVDPDRRHVFGIKAGFHMAGQATTGYSTVRDYPFVKLASKQCDICQMGPDKKRDFFFNGVLISLEVSCKTECAARGHISSIK